MPDKPQDPIEAQVDETMQELKAEAEVLPPDLPPQDLEIPDEPDVQEKRLQEMKAEAEVLAKSDLPHITSDLQDEQPTCFDCVHEFQLQCHVGGMDKVRSIKPTDHCKHHKPKV